MAGRYIPEEMLDPEAVKCINERYEYLRRIDSHATTNVKIRRMLAWAADWVITAFVAMLLTFVAVAFFIAVF